MLTQDKVEFYQGSQAEYDATTKSANKLYFTSDTHRIYKGEDLYSGTGGGGATVQSDYTMNDSTDPSYIKNREFYTEEETTKYEGRYIVVTQDILDSSMEGISFSISDKPIGLVEGQTYTVKWNDSEPVSAAAVNMSSMIGIDVVGIVNTDVEPYYYVVDKCKLQVAGSDVAFVKDDNSVTYYYGSGFTVGSTIQVTGDGIADTEITETEIHKLPGKYLTQSDYTVNDVEDAAYIKNRQFYAETLPGRQYTVTQDDILAGATDGLIIYLSPIGLIIGETYTVTINDTIYENLVALNGKDYGISTTDIAALQVTRNMIIFDKFQYSAVSAGAANENVCSFVNDNKFETDAVISVTGKVAEMPSRTFSVGSLGFNSIAHIDSLGLIIGNSYIISTGSFAATLIAKDLHSDEDYGEYFAEGTIGLVSSNPRFLLVDRYNYSNTATYAGTVDDNVCTLNWKTTSTGGPSFSISGQFSPHSFERIHKLPEKYLPDTVQHKSFYKEITFAGKDFTAQPTYTPTDIKLTDYFKSFEEDRMFYWVHFVGTSKYEFQLKYCNQDTYMTNGADEAIGGITFTTDSTDLYNSSSATSDTIILVYFTEGDDENSLIMHYGSSPSSTWIDIIPDNLKYLDIDIYSTSVEPDPLHLDDPEQLYTNSIYDLKLATNGAILNGYNTGIKYSVDNVVKNTEGVGIYPTVADSGHLYKFNVMGTIEANAPADLSATYLTALMHNHVRVQIDARGEYSEVNCEGYSIGKMINPSPVKNPNTIYSLQFDRNIFYKNVTPGTPLGLIENKYYKVDAIVNYDNGSVRTVSVGTFKAQNLKNSSIAEVANKFTYDCIGLVTDGGTIGIADGSSYDSNTGSYSQSSTGFVAFTPIQSSDATISYRITGPQILGDKIADMYRRPELPKYFGTIPMSSRHTCSKSILGTTNYSSIQLDGWFLPGDKIIFQGEYK